MGAFRGKKLQGNWPSFAAFIDSVGIAQVAKKLRVCRKTVTNWRYQGKDPRVNQMRKIRSWTGGAVSYDMMIDRKPTPFLPYVVVTE